MFDNIYKNYSYFTGIAANHIGVDNPFVEDIVSSTIVKLLKGIESGKIDTDKICCNGQIKIPYFRYVVRNASIDYIRSQKKVKRIKLVEIKDSIEEEELTDKYEYAKEELAIIRTRLEEFEKDSLDNKFHADVFSYIYFQGLSITTLEEETGINYRTLRKSKLLIIKKCKEWLEEERVKDLEMI